MSDISASARSFEGPTPRTGALDILGVYILPLLCLVGAIIFYPFTFYPNEQLVALWTLTVCSMIVFALAGRSITSQAFRSFLTGALLASGIVALATGVVLLSISIRLFPVLMQLGPLGLVSLLTGWRLLSRALQLTRIQKIQSAPALLGMIAVIALSGLVSLLVSFANHAGNKRRMMDLLSGDRERVLRALSRDAIYGPRDVIGRPVQLTPHICQYIERIPLQDGAVRQAAQKWFPISDPNQIEDFCRGYRSRGYPSPNPLPP